MRRISALVLLAVLSACGDSGGTSTTGGSSESSTGGDESTVAAVTTSEAPTSTGTTIAGGTSSGETTGSSSETTGDESSTGEPVVAIEEALDSIDGLEWEEVDPQLDGYRYFLLYFQQPADHSDPEGLKFTQHMTLLHRDASAPTVIGTDGYFIYPWYQGLSEPARLLHANQLTVEHRFFADSRPEPADWTLLTIEQAAADHHRITEALQTAIYKAPWVATGVSKGGMTSTYFRRFYPDDVAATVAYVAPLSLAAEDPRYWPYLEMIDDPCNAALTDFRRELLLRREAMLGRIADEADQEGLTYDFIDMERALEVTALNVTWGFWQYGGAFQCPGVPSVAATDGELWDFLQGVAPVRDASDARMAAFEPYFWQASTQLGAPGTDETALSDLLMYPGFDVSWSYVMPGPGKDPVYDPAAMQDIKTWMADEASAMLFVYGERDPWTAGMYEVDPGHDVHRLMAAGANHSADISQLSDEDRAFAYARLEAWTGVTPVVRPLPPELPLRDRLQMTP